MHAVVNFALLRMHLVHKYVMQLHMLIIFLDHLFSERN